MPINSKRKGANGERQLAKFLTERGYPAHRGVQYQGGNDSPDVVCPLLKDFHFEAKYTEKLRLYPALDQATDDSNEHQIPIVAHRRNRREWVAILRLEDLLKLLK